MHDLYSTQYHLVDIERSARRDIAQARRQDRARTFKELAEDLIGIAARSFSPFAQPVDNRQSDMKSR